MAEHLPELAFAAALAWASGLRLYLVVFLVGAAGHFGLWALPEHLQVLSHPLVLAASGFMVLVEFFADKIPFVDNLWDAVHTFVRIPGGAALAAAALGDSSEAGLWAAAIVGGGLAALAHSAKTGSRAVINASPEPFTNWAASFSEESLVLGGLWTAWHYPLAFLVALGVFLVLALWILVRLARKTRGWLANRRAPRPT
jgi:hypothetical protein